MQGTGGSAQTQYIVLTVKLFKLDHQNMEITYIHNTWLVYHIYIMKKYTITAHNFNNLKLYILTKASSQGVTFGTKESTNSFFYERVARLFKEGQKLYYHFYC